MNYYERLSDSELRGKSGRYMRGSSLNAFVKAVSERETFSYDEKVNLLKGYGSTTQYHGSIRVSLWELVKMIQKGKDVEMTANLDKSVAPLVEEKLLYTDNKIVTATVQDSELGEIEITRSIKVIRLSALGHKLSEPIIEKVKTHVANEMKKYQDLGLIA